MNRWRGSHVSEPRPAGQHLAARGCIVCPGRGAHEPFSARVRSGLLRASVSFCLG